MAIARSVADAATDLTNIEAPAPLLAVEDVVAVGAPNGWFCTGILVAPDMVLTAAHCAVSRFVLFGARVDHPKAIIPVGGRINHPDGADLALLVLDAPVATPARQWHLSAEAPVGRLRAVGYGLTGRAAEGRAGIKHEIPLMAQGWSCEGSAAAAAGCEPGWEMVIYSPDGSDTCDGDSGGPLLAARGDDWELVGIVSRAVANAGRACGDGGIYVRVDTAATWLQTEIRRNSRYFLPQR
jgi:hypothetical protein